MSFYPSTGRPFWTRSFHPNVTELYEMQRLQIGSWRGWTPNTLKRQAPLKLVSSISLLSMLNAATVPVAESWELFNDRSFPRKQTFRWRPNGRKSLSKLWHGGKQSQLSFRRREDSRIKAIWGEERTPAWIIEMWSGYFADHSRLPAPLANRSCCRGRFWWSTLFSFLFQPLYFCFSVS